MGLSKAGKDWNDYLHIQLKNIGLRQCTGDPCVYYATDLVVGVYVDDLLLVGKREEIMEF
jgi:hypothetical protein